MPKRAPKSEAVLVGQLVTDENHSHLPALPPGTQALPAARPGRLPANENHSHLPPHFRVGRLHNLDAIRRDLAKAMRAGRRGLIPLDEVSRLAYISRVLGDLTVEAQDAPRIAALEEKVERLMALLEKRS